MCLTCDTISNVLLFQISVGVSWGGEQEGCKSEETVLTLDLGPRLNWREVWEVEETRRWGGWLLRRSGRQWTRQGSFGLQKGRCE